MFANQWPWSNTHELNLDWILAELKKTREEVASVKDFDSKYINVLTIGIKNDTSEPIPANALSGYKYLYFPTGSYRMDEIINLSGADIIAEKDAVFTGEGKFYITDCKITGGTFRNSAGGIRVVDGENVINGALFQSRVTGTNDLTIFNTKKTDVINCEFDGGQLSRFGIWADNPNSNTFINVKSCILHDYYLNAIFTSSECMNVTGCYFYNNHHQTTPNGGGQIDIVEKTTPAHCNIIGCYFTSPAASATTAIETEGSTIMVIGCYINMKGGNWGIAGQDTTTIIAAANLFECNSNQTPIKGVDSQSKFYLIGNRYDGPTTPYNIRAANCLYAENFGGDLQTTSNTGLPYVIAGDGTIINRTFEQGDLVRLFHEGSGYISVTVDSIEARYYFKSPSTLTKVYGTLPSGVGVHIFQYYIEIKNNSTTPHVIELRRI